MALNVQKTSSSNSFYSNSTRNWKFDVFLSFRGEDTRRCFTDHLYDALCKKGFRVFIDEELERGEIISKKLQQAIKDSYSAIVIVSKNYASSSCCLDELQHILTSRTNLGQQVLPIFYQVDPSDVRHQRGSFAEAFARLEDKFQEDEQKLQNWRDSLTKVADLSGWDSKYWHEAQLIERVVEELWTKLHGRFPSNNDILIGIDQKVHQLESHLKIGWNDILFVGIWGLGGVGKTTLARAVFEKFHNQFDICCFLANVRTTSERDDGEVYLQRKLLSCLKIRNMEIEDTCEGKKIIQKHCSKLKVLLVLDDVSSIIHLQNLAESLNWFGARSRVIITTRDLHLLKAHGVHEVYEVKTMHEDESLQLFCQKAFKRDKPPEEFLELSKSICDYTGGLPLALSILGSFFCGRSVLEWEDALDMLKKDPNKGIFRILRISYDALSDAEKAIFLDIACFFNHKEDNKIKQILESCGHNSTIGISTLIEKSLLKVNNGKYLEMHDLLEQMGRRVVFEESPHDARKRSRLWLKEDVNVVLEKNMGTKAIQAVVSNISCGACWNPEAFSSLCNLRLLIISRDIKLPHGLMCLPSTLKVLHWTKYPLSTLPIGTQLAQLVDLKMLHSNLNQLWNKSQCLESLKFLDLSHSKYLIKIPNFSEFPNLEVLELEGCVALVDLHPSIGNHRKIRVLNLKGCRNLKVLPRKLEMTSLKEFVLCGCNKIINLPEFGENMKSLLALNVGETSIVKLPKSLGLLTNLETLNLKGCKSLLFLPRNIYNLKCLKAVDISGCSQFSTLPEKLNENEALEELDISGTAIREVLSSIFYLKNLRRLSVRGCRRPFSWMPLLLNHRFQLQPFPKGLIIWPASIFNFKSLKKLDLSYRNIDFGTILDDLKGLSSLEKLNLSGVKFVNLPGGYISNLLKLRTLRLNSCPGLETSPQPSESLDTVDVGKCSSLETLPDKQSLHSSHLIKEGGQDLLRIGRIEPVSFTNPENYITSQSTQIFMASDQQASSSNSNSTQSWEYHIFLSFRGEDTRRGFTDHLYHALLNRGFRVFRDEEDLERGEVISEDLLQAIENSLYSIVILSENYASSSWCLDELQHILASRNKLGRQVLPIFYHVDPSDVRHQRGSVAEAFNKHEETFKDDPDKVQKWRDSLAKVADLAGWHSPGWYETQLIASVVERVWYQIRSELPLVDSDTLIEIDWRVDEIYSHLRIGIDDVLFIGIWGIGGVGKTTLARVIYDRFQNQFDFHCFLANVREISERDGIVHFQRKLLSLLKIKDTEIADACEGKKIIRNLFSNRKVMLILDDVNSKSQLQYLVGSHCWFGDGSRVIITTRDVSLLRPPDVDKIYEVKPMNDDESLRLFCQKAFGRDQPRDGFLEMSKLVINYAGGLPLALIVLGSFLFGRSVREWKDALNMLKKDPNNNIFKILRISYDALNPEEKTMFLDIACFFNIWGKDEVEQILKSCGLLATIGMRNLIEKSLLAEIEVGNNKYIEMHNLVQEMGRTIVFDESHDDVERRSRLWLAKDIDKVLKKNIGTEATKGVVLPFSFAKDEAYWNPEAFSRMLRLRLLIISCNFGLPRGLTRFARKLKVLHWYGYPLDALPFEANLEELVYLKMQNSKMTRLANDGTFMEDLKLLDLSHSKKLIESPHFYAFPDLEGLVLEGCTGLVEIHPSLGHLDNLHEVNLKGCVNLRVLPRQMEMASLKKVVLEDTGIEEVPASLVSLTSVEVLNLRSCRNLKVLPTKLEMNSLKEFVLSGCTQVTSLPEFGESMKKIITFDAKETGIAKLPESFGSLTSLQTLNLSGCQNLVGLPHNIHKLKELKFLDISRCSTFSKLPENLNENKALEKIDASETAITEVPSCIGHLEELRTLSFRGCSPSKGLTLPTSIFITKSLTELDLSNCNIADGFILNDLGGLSSLRKLDLAGNLFVNLSAGCISKLLNLRLLYLNSCPKLQLLPYASPGLDLMDVGDCDSLSTSNERLLNLFASIDRSGQYAEGLSHRLNADSWASLSIKTFSATLPGSEIPSLFKSQKSLSLNRESENSITVDVPPCEWLGFVLCTVLEDDMFYSNEASQNIFCWRSYLAKASDGNLVFLQGSRRELEKEIKSPHLWILFGQIGNRNGSCLSMDYNQLLLKFETQKNRQNSIKCGWLVMSKMDFESLPSTMEDYEDLDNARGCEVEEVQGESSLSVSESYETIVKECDTKSPDPSSTCLQKEVKLEDSQIQYITDNASDCDSTPPRAIAAIAIPPTTVQSPTSSNCRECQPSERATSQENTWCSEAQEQGQCSLLSVSEDCPIIINKCGTMSLEASSPCLEEESKLNDLQMQFLTHDVSHYVTVNPSMATPPAAVQSPLSNYRPSVSATTQEGSICTGDSIGGTVQVPISVSKQKNPSRETNDAAGDALLAHTISQASTPHYEQTSAEKIFEELSQVSDLEDTELVQIYDILTSNERKYESFKALPSRLRKHWISIQIKKYNS